MTDNRPSEKMTEMLFCRYALQTFGLQDATLYAPSSRQEFINGYDAAFVGGASCRELYLQFKRPSRAWGRFRIKLVPHQHERLQHYPPGAAFYVGHIFESVQELQQAHKGIRTAKEFLKYFVAVDVNGIAPNASRIEYDRSDKTSQPSGVRYRCQRGKSAPQHTVPHGKWYRGGQLLDLYKRGGVGHHVTLADSTCGRQELTSQPLSINVADNIERIADLELFAEEAYPVAHRQTLSIETLAGFDGSRGEFGTALRVYE